MLVFGNNEFKSLVAKSLAAFRRISPAKMIVNRRILIIMLLLIIKFLAPAKCSFFY